MTQPIKEHPLSEAGAEDKNKATTPNFIENLSELLQEFQEVKHFCLFTGNKEPIGKSQTNKAALKLGVSTSTINPAEQFTSADLKSGALDSMVGWVKPKYLGITFNKVDSVLADGSTLVCLDFDGKRATEEARQKFDSYKKFVIKKGYLYEESVSGKGFHVFFKTNRPMPAHKWIYGDETEIEFFPSNGAKSVCLTGRDLSGSLKFVEDPILELNQQGLFDLNPTKNTTHTESTLKPRVSVFSADDVDRIALTPENMARWVSVVFPSAICTPDGRWRVKSADLGRDLEEDLSISENGIKDFGLHDLPDELNAGKYTPTQLVAEWKFGGEREWKSARDWLREICGMPAFSKTEPSTKSFLADIDLLDLKPTPVDFLVDRIYPEGLGVIAGSPGSGKSTALIPCAVSVAGLTELPVLVRRKVLFFTEDTLQLLRSLIGIKSKHNLTNGELAEWIKVYPAQRLSAEQLKTRLKEAIKLHTIAHEKYGVVSPLVVLDTTSANMEMADENSSSQVSAHTSALKELMFDTGASVWLVAHLPKSAKGILIDELANFSARGSGAFEGDASWTALVGRASEESNETIIKIDKERTCGVIRGMEISCKVEFNTALGVNRLGETEDVPFPVVDISIVSKNERKKNAFEDRLADAIELIKGALASPCTDDGYLVMSDLRKVLGGNKDNQTKIITELQKRKWILKGFIPKNERSNPQRKECFILGEEAKNAYF